MQTRLEPENTHAPLPPGLPAVEYAAFPDVEIETPYLPHDHPAWARDAIALSMRARDLLAKFKPVAVKILTFWDHTIRSIIVANRRLTVDVSGSYRID